MAVRNIFVVWPDPDRWSSERPAFTPEPVGPRPMEEDIVVSPSDLWWMALALVLVLLSSIAGS